MSASRSFACPRSMKERGGLDIQPEVLAHRSEVDVMSMVSAAISFSSEMADLTSKSVSSLINSVSSRWRSRFDIASQSCGVVRMKSSENI